MPVITTDVSAISKAKPLQLVRSGSGNSAREVANTPCSSCLVSSPAGLPLLPVPASENNPRYGH